MKTFLPGFDKLARYSVPALLLLFLACPPSFGWGKDGHEITNYVAARMFPKSLPAFLLTTQAQQEIRYLGPEPDRWREPENSALNAWQAPEHFIDMEWAEIAAPNGLPEHLREFVRDLYAAGRKHPRMAEDLTPQKVGMLPWQADEVFERLLVDMRNYRALVAAHKSTHGVQIAILFDIGWLGHYVGDGSEPLHTSINYNGWVEKQNPEHFTRAKGIHWQFESKFVHDNITAGDVLPLVPKTPRVLERPFQDFVAYLKTSNSQVAEVYQLYKECGFFGHGTPQSRRFTSRRLAAGAGMLRNMVYTAWVDSAKPLPEQHYYPASSAHEKHPCTVPSH